MGPVTAIKTCFRKYVMFSGRASRPEFWWFMLFIFVMSILLAFVDAIIFGPQENIRVMTPIDGGEPVMIRSQRYGGQWISLIFQLGILLPSLAASWRRMHDLGKSGWYALVPSLIGIGLLLLFAVLQNPTGMIIGGLIYLALTVYIIVLLASRSDPNPNRFGPPPGQLAAEDAKTVFE